MNFKGKGEHSVNELEKMCKDLIEENIELKVRLSKSMEEIEERDLIGIEMSERAE